ncbi:MAG: CoA transferase [Chitinophagales bacterium]|nr:MAG: CoA transferase [Chitinophagales bacterium]
MSPEFPEIVSSLPARFRAEKAEGVSAVIHFDLSGEGWPFTVIIEGGRCTVEKGLVGTATCIIRTDADSYVQLEKGELNPQAALLSGRVEVSNLMEVMRFTRLFRRYEESDAPGTATMRPEKEGPLKGLKIVDFTRLLPGPLATMLMADLGAEVIKIEDPDAPDYIRSFPPFIGNDSAYYISLNRGKRSVAVNYSVEEGKEIVRRLIREADVVIEQFRPGVMDALGLGYAACAQQHPRLIYVSLTGYGQTGPYAACAGHDLNYIGYSGLLETTGTKEAPVIPGGQIADVAAGSYMTVNAVLAALYARERTGKGQHLDVSMLDCVIPMMALQIASYYGSRKEPSRGDFSLSGAIANYNVYRCADGRFVALGALEPKFWENFCDLVGKPEWKTRMLNSGADMHALKEEVAALFLSKTRDQWIQLCEGKDVCLTPVLSIAELEQDPHIRARQMLVPDERYPQMKLLGRPLKFSASGGSVSWSAPALGADTTEVLRAAGYTPEQIAAFRKRNIIR